jgi:hypothetical protein
MRGISKGYVEKITTTSMVGVAVAVYHHLHRLQLRGAHERPTPAGEFAHVVTAAKRHTGNVRQRTLDAAANASLEKSTVEPVMH